MGQNSEHAFSAQTNSRILSCNTASPLACLLSRGTHRQSLQYNFASTPLALHILRQTKRRRTNILSQTSQKKHMQICIISKLVSSGTDKTPRPTKKKLYGVRKVTLESTLSIALNSILRFSIDSFCSSTHFRYKLNDKWH